MLNNLEFDHADIFADVAAIETQFHHLVRCVRASGRLIVNGVDAALTRVLQRGCWSQVDRFNDPEGWHAARIEEGRLHEFDVMVGSTVHGRVRLALAGEHNRCNALAAIAAASAAGVEPGRAIEALGIFAGVRRRLEVAGEAFGVTVEVDGRVFGAPNDMRRRHERRARAVVDDARRRQIGGHAAPRPDLGRPFRATLARLDRRHGPAAARAGAARLRLCRATQN